MADDEPDDLSPAEELELRRRRDAEAERKRHAKVNRLLRAEYRKAKAGTDLWPTREQIDAKRAELIEAGKPHGLRPLADAFEVKVGKIRRRLAKSVRGTSSGTPPGTPHPPG